MMHDDDDVTGTEIEGGAATAVAEVDDAAEIEDARPAGQLSFDMPARAMSVLDGARYIPVELIHPDPEQPRKEPDDELKDSVKLEGVLQPITVRSHPELLGQWMIVFGERRWKAASAAGLHDVPCLIRDDQEDAAERLRTQLTENTSKALTPIEEAESFARLLELRQCTPAELARWLGKPASTVHQRLQMMMLGPWVPLVRKGSVSYTLLVKHVLRFRGCPAEVHQAAVDHFTTRLAEYAPDVPQEDDVAMEVRQVVLLIYGKSLYPLTKTRENWQVQPEFDTKAHDAECDCGRIVYSPDEDDPDDKGREYCGNPGWWKPLQRAARRAAKEKEAAKSPGKASSSGRGEKIPFKVPTGAKEKKVGYSDGAPGITRLLDSSGRWAADRAEDLFDPGDLPKIAASDLVVLKPQYGTPTLGTTDKRAVDIARKAWRARRDEQRSQLALQFKAAMEKKATAYVLTGSGVRTALAAIADHWPNVVRDVAEACGLKPPAEKLKWHDGRRRDGELVKWTEKQTPAKASEVLAGVLACLDDASLSIPTQQIDAWVQKEAARIRGLKVQLPVAGEAEGPAPATKVKRAAPKSTKATKRAAAKKGAKKR